MLLIANTLAITCDDQRRVMADAGVLIDGDRIAAVGPSGELERQHPQAERLDGSRLAVLPGLINAHTHTVLLALRGTVEDWEGDAVYGYMSPISYAMSAEERAVFATLGCLEAIRSGTTTLVDPFRHVGDYAGAMAATGMRL